MSGLPDERAEAVRVVASYLSLRTHPRLFISAILAVTIAVATLSSVVMLRLGESRMWLRYPMAALLAYGVFLSLVGLWQRYQLTRTDLLQDLEHLDAAPEPPAQVPRAGGNRFNPLDAVILPDDTPGPFLIALVVGGVALLCIAGVVAAAPVLLAEVLLDGLLVAGLWRRVRERSGVGLFTGALRVTWLPVSVVILVLGAAGWILQWVDPAARSIGDLFRDGPR